MPLFEQSLPIHEDLVSQQIAQHWHLHLDKRIKASQNHTYLAHHLQDTTRQYSVRITPDPQHQHYTRIVQEVQFVTFIKQLQDSNNQDYHLHICSPVASCMDGNYVLQVEDMVIVVFEWAKGVPLDFFQSRWRVDPEVGFAWGRSLAELHRLSQAYHQTYPEEAAKIQRWDQVHESIAKGTPVADEDLALMTDPAHYGILHGDLNISNFFFMEEKGQPKALSVFDWDQTQQGWFLLDLAQAEFGIYMLAEGGSLIDGSPVEDAIPERFEQFMVDGYESVFGKGFVDRDRLKRMVNMRMYFYETFCRTAKAEGNLPADMEYFINYVIRWFDKKRGIVEPTKKEASTTV